MTLRVLSDRLLRRPKPSGLNDPPAANPISLEQRAVLMRRGDHDCHRWEHQAAMHRLAELVVLHEQAETDRDYWKRRALHAEAKLRYPEPPGLAAA